MTCRRSGPLAGLGTSALSSSLPGVVVAQTTCSVCAPDARRLETRCTLPASAAVVRFDPADLTGVIEGVAARHGGLDVLINNAAVLFLGEFHDMAPESIERLVHTNLTAVIVGTLHASKVISILFGGHADHSAEQTA